MKEILAQQGANIAVVAALIGAGIGAVAFIRLLDLRLARINPNSTPAVQLNSKSPFTAFMSTALMLVLGAMALYSVRSSISIFRSRQDTFRNYANETLYKKLSHGKGLIATAPKIYMAQLITRRPILLDVEALDMLPYALEGAAQMHRILMVVYGVDLLSPPPDGLRQGTLPIEPTKTIWLTRTPEQWVEIKNEFGVTDILVQSDWKLQLSGMTGNDEFTAYHIP
ncbi:MAG: hypothetical protein HZB77_12835 [Chloroflexi bacterium]|nr:hypothetical protein [Chloroflexota bacterium]